MPLHRVPVPALLGLFILLGSCATPVRAPARDEQVPVARDLELSLSSRRIVRGSLLRATLTLHGAASTSEIPFIGEWAGKTIPFQPSLSGVSQRWEAFFAVPYEQDPASLALCVKPRGGADHCLISASVEVLAGEFPSRTLKVDQKKVEPPPEEQRRIEREQEELNRIYASSPGERLWSGPFRLPIKSKVTSPFGVQRLYNGKRKSFHAGLDLRAGIGTAVRAAGRGRVVLAKDLYFTGNTVILDHGFGLFTLYCHLSEIGVSDGQLLEPGDLIGKSGDTGRVTGPHLHWAAKANVVFFNPVDLTRASLMSHRGHDDINSH